MKINLNLLQLFIGFFLVTQTCAAAVNEITPQDKSLGGFEKVYGPTTIHITVTNNTTLSYHFQIIYNQDSSGACDLSEEKANFAPPPGTNFAKEKTTQIDAYIKKRCYAEFKKDTIKFYVCEDASNTDCDAHTVQAKPKYNDYAYLFYTKQSYELNATESGYTVTLTSASIN